MPLLLSRKDVESVLTMQDAIDAVENGFRQLALGHVILPQRTAIRMSDFKGLHLGMPAYIGGDDGFSGALGLKVVTVYPNNPSEFNLPTTMGTLLLNDVRTGALVSIMDAGYLTAVRTGAVSGVATKHLARKDARSAGIFGGGAMGRTQLEAVCEVRRITEARIYDPVVETRERFASEMSERLMIPVLPVTSPRLCATADIVCTATSSKTPVFEASWLRPGAHVNGVGSHSADSREIDAQTLVQAKVVTDYRPACMAEAGDLTLAISDGSYSEERIHADLGEVIAGLKPGRSSDEELTLFKSVGLAVQDISTAVRVYERALAGGVGTRVEI